MSRISDQIRREEERRRDEQRRRDEERRHREQEENRRRVEENNRRQEAKRREDEARRAREEQERRRQSEAHWAKVNADRAANNLASLQRNQPDNWMAIRSAESSVQSEKMRSSFAAMTISAEDRRLHSKSVAEPKPLLFPVNLDKPRRVSKPPGPYWRPSGPLTDPVTVTNDTSQPKIESKSLNTRDEGKSSSQIPNQTIDCGIKSEINVDPSYDSNILKYGTKIATLIPGGGPAFKTLKLILKTDKLVNGSDAANKSEKEEP